MKIKIVYFIYLLPDKWINIFIEQMDALKSTDLYEEADEIFISVISDDVQLQILQSMLCSKYSKLKIYNVYKDNVYEYPGIKAIYEIARDDNDTIILYFHSKGMTSNLAETRKKLFKYTIQNYKTYVNEFSQNKSLDVAGAIPHKEGFVFINFFWARSSYIKNFCTEPPKSDNRYIYEIWLGNQYSKKQNIITFSPIIGYNTVTTHPEVYHIENNMIL